MTQIWTMAGLGANFFENAPHRRPLDIAAPGNLDGADTLRGEQPHLIGLGPRRRLPAFVFAIAFRLGDAFALALEHRLALECGDRAQHGQHQFAGRRRGVETAEIEDPDASAFGRDLLDDAEQVLDAARQAVELRDDELVIVAQIIDCRGQLRPMRGDTADPLAEELCAAALVQR